MHRSHFWKHYSFVNFFILLALLGLAACEPQPGTATYGGPGGEYLNRFIRKAQDEAPADYALDVHFKAELPSMKKSGKMAAFRWVNNVGRVFYKMISFEGDETVKKDVIARFMTAETKVRSENIAEKSIGPENYKFKYVGRVEFAGRTGHSFALNPRHKKPGLFKGQLIIDSETFLPLLEEGKFVRPPSVFLSDVEFRREFQIIDGRAVPKMLETTVNTRFWGKALIEVSYSGYKHPYLKPESKTASYQQTTALMR